MNTLNQLQSWDDLDIELKSDNELHNDGGDMFIKAWWDIDEQVYCISYHNGRMPAHRTDRFEMASALISELVSMEPDANQWYLRFDHDGNDTLA